MDVSFEIFTTLSDHKENAATTVAATIINNFTNTIFNETIFWQSDNDSIGYYDCKDDNSNSMIASPYYQSFVYIMYSAIFVIALGGNGIVCYIVQSTPRMQTVTNYFIMNLAVGDILVTVFCIPFTSIGTMLLQVGIINKLCICFTNQII